MKVGTLVKKKKYRGCGRWSWGVVIRKLPPTSQLSLFDAVDVLWKGQPNVCLEYTDTLEVFP